MNKKWMYLLLFGVLAWLVSAVFISAQAVDQLYHYDSIDVNIDIQSNSDMDITETQKLVYQSGTFYYAYRWIPLDRIDIIDSVSVSEGNRLYPENPAVRKWIEERQEDGTAPGGNSYAFSTWIDNNKRWIGWWFPATSGMSRTWIIKYHVQGGMLIGQNKDELYWKAVFGDRTVPVNTANVSVNFPEILNAEEVQIASYGAAAASRVAGKSVTFAAQNIPSEEELEIQIRFPHGMVKASPSPWQINLEKKAAYDSNVKPWINICLMIIGVIIVPIISFIWLRRKLAGRGAKLRFGAPDTVYQAPDALPPAFVGLLTGGGSQGANITGTIFDLARRGILRIEEVETTYRLFGTRKKKDIAVTRVNQDEKYRFEKLVADTLSSPEGKKISEQTGKLPAMVKQFQKEVELAAVEEGLFHEEPSRSRNGLVIPAMILLVAAPVVGIALSAFLFSYAELIFVPFLVMFIVGIVAMALSPLMVQFTDVGAEKAAQCRGFRKFLKKAAGDVIVAKDSLNVWDNIFGLCRGVWFDRQLDKTLHRVRRAGTSVVLLCRSPFARSFRRILRSI